MKKLVLIAILLPFYGCEALDLDSMGGGGGDSCPEKPNSTLESRNVEAISLNQGPITKSGQVTLGNSKGYTFEGAPGDELRYFTDDNVCVWVSSPDNSLVEGTELGPKGNYVLQVSALSGSTSYDIEMRLGDLEAVDSTAPPQPDSTSSGFSNSSESDSNGSIANNLESNDSNALSESDAESLVQRYLDAKAEVFSPPYNRQIVGQLTTGQLYRDITKEGGSIDWLQKNGSRYVYSDSSIKTVWEFSPDLDRPAIKVSIFEDRVLLKSDGRRDSSNSGASTDNFIYYFERDDGTWKIEDYEKSS